MNSETPQNQNSEFSKSFDSDEIEIDVDYEEISPEEQLEIKNNFTKKSSSANKFTDTLSDMWLDDNPEIIDVEIPGDSIEESNNSNDIDELKTKANLERLKDTEKNETNESKVKVTKETEMKGEEILTNSSLTTNLSDNLASDNSESNFDLVSEVATTEIEGETENAENKLITQSTTSKQLSDRQEKSSESLEIKSQENTVTNLEATSKHPKIESPESNETTTDDLVNDFLTDVTETKAVETSGLEQSAASSEDSESNFKSTSENLQSKVIETEPEIETETNFLDDLIEATNFNTSEENLSAKELPATINNELDFPESQTSTEPELTTSQSGKTITSELIADSWLDESENLASDSEQKKQRHQELTSEITALERQKSTLQTEISELKAQKETLISQQTQEIAESLFRMIEEGTRELRERKNNLLIDIEKLEKRRERIRQEMRETFAGTSQDLAIRIQSFKQYLVGSLQDLATTAERLDLPQPEERRRATQRDTIRTNRSTREDREDRQSRRTTPQPSSPPQFAEQPFTEQSRRINQLLDKYRTKPDYYGSPWQLRRTFEPIHSERVREWFFERGGRGAIKGMGSRLQNILVASAVVSILYRLYSDRIRVLVLVDTPEKLGEWRRGLQDCLGVSRNDFGSNRGIVLFESTDVLVQRADRLLKDKLLPVIIIDETEELVNLALLKFPLWLAFAEQSQPKSSGYLY